ncbi:pilus assembly protein [Pseudomonas taeanensis]|uniref:pilus assembly protein n=1 Tax=Pseudomonas taeanensis TaxID=574962 RepID=UPI0004ADFB5D|nr:PilC/PilY family type IV pilus protein [Pseudomonas taeanensis]
MFGLTKTANTMRYALATLSFVHTMGISLTASALTIDQAPLFLSTQVTPNVIMAIDDSGSMDAELLLPTNDGAAWWRVNSDATKTGFFGWGTNADYSADAWVGGAQMNFNQAGGADATWKKFIYIFPNGSDSSKGGRVYGDSTNDHFAVPPLPTLAYVRSVAYNKAYFDPLQTYAPWPSLGGQSFSNMPATAAKADPGRSSSLTLDLTANVELKDSNQTFRLFSGMRIPSGTKIYLNSAWQTLTTAGTVPYTPVSGGGQLSNDTSYGISYFPATFYAESASALPVGYGYTASPMLSGYSPGASSPDLYLYEIKPANFSTTAQYQMAIQNFANWFSYYRKRQLATRGGVAASFKDMTTIRAATYRINNRSTLTMRNLSLAADRDSFFQDVMAPTGSGGTPNREALLHAGEQLMRTDVNAPVQYSCQSNAAILFTDGFSNASSVSPAPGNADGDQGSPYADSVSDTIADIAMKYYKTPLRTGTGFPSGRVPVVAACNTANPPAGTDCNRNLHMLTYGVTLGSKGILFDPDVVTDPYANPPAWWNSFSNRSPRAVDDLWHATLNGRGQMLNAKTPTEVAKAIKIALSSIIARTGSASAVASNSTRLDTDTFVYQAKFNSADWSGELLAYSIAANGQISSQAWTTDNGIPSASARNIVTWNGAQGIDFVATNWLSLSQSQRDALNNGDALGLARLEWIRGSNTLEQNQGGGFRNRTKKLGDIVNSDPLFVKSQDYGFSVLATEGASYASYVAGKQSRTPMLFVGANDGMMHGFNASTGMELFAFIPSGVFGSVAQPKIAALTDPGYTHRYLVDGPARSSDAYINGVWKTMLVGSTGAGGKSVFALDISNPSGLGAGSVTWENSTTGTAMSHPVIARLASGDWVAIYGNGYDSGENVKLNIVRLSDGVLLKSIDTGVSGTGNGLATPLPVDTNNDRITDAVYAGDLLGNMWKFDLSSANANQWGVAYKQGSTPKPLFTAVSGSGQAITARATAGRNPDGNGVMIYFGTGKYFESGDNVVGSSPQLQRFYGVYDDGSQVTALSSLVQQTITNEGAISGFGGYRVTSTNTVDYVSKKGWYLDLKSPGASNGAGERVVSQALLRDGRIIFTTLIPSSDACAYGGKSWLMELDAINGGRLAYSVYDVNGDGQVDENDYVTLSDGSKVPVGGKGFDEIIKTPGIIGAGDLEYKYTSGSSGTLSSTVEVGSGNIKGRQSWRQLQ